MKVPLHFVNGEVSPAVKLHEAIISHVMTEVDVSCLPKDLPEYIEVDLSELDTGHSIHVSVLVLPDGVSVATRGKLDPVVATAVIPRAPTETEEEVAPADEAAVAAATPAADAKAGDKDVDKSADKSAEKKGDKGAEKKGDKKDDRKDDKKK